MEPSPPAEDKLPLWKEYLLKRGNPKGSTADKFLEGEFQDPSVIEYLETYYEKRFELHLLIRIAEVKAEFGTDPRTIAIEQRKMLDAIMDAKRLFLQKKLD